MWTTSATAAENDLLDGMVGQRAQTVMELAVCGDYDSALAEAALLEHDKPNTPLTPFYTMVCLGMRDLDFDSTIDSSGFLDAYQKTLLRIDMHRDRPHDSLGIQLIDGYTQAVYSAFCLHKGEYLGGVQEGFSALDKLAEVKKQDSTCADAYLFAGLYEYAKGEIKRRLWWIFFWYPGNKKEGIRQLVFARDNGNISSLAARIALAEIYIRESSYDLAETELEGLKGRFGRSRFILWTQAKLHEARGKYGGAADGYGILARSYDDAPAGTYNARYTRYLQAQMLVEAGRTAEAAEICAALVEELQENTVPRYKKLCAQARKLMGSIDGKSYR